MTTSELDRDGEKADGEMRGIFAIVQNGSDWGF